MNRTLKRLLIFGVVAILLFSGIITWGVLKLFSLIEPRESNIPAAIAQPRILTGEGLLSKSEFLKLEQVSYWDILRSGGGSADKKTRERATHAAIARTIYGFEDLKFVNGQVIAVAKFGGFVLQNDGTLLRSLTFEPTEQNVKIGPFDFTIYDPADDNLRIVEPERGKFGVSSLGYTDGFVLFNDSGDQVFSYGRDKLERLFDDSAKRDPATEVYTLEAAVGDIDNDGIAEFAVSRKTEGIHLFDRSGNERWLYREEFASNPMVFQDYNGDGKADLLCLGDKAIGADGKPFASLKGIQRDSSVLLVDDNSKTAPKLVFCNLGLREFDCRLDGQRVIFSAVAPLRRIYSGPDQIDNYESLSSAKYVGNVRVVMARLKPDSRPVYAVVGGFVGIERGNFWIFDQYGTLLYHELMPEKTQTVTAVPLPNGTDSILVGGKSTIWKYTPN